MREMNAGRFMQRGGFERCVSDAFVRQKWERGLSMREFEVFTARHFHFDFQRNQMPLQLSLKAPRCIAVHVSFFGRIAVLAGLMSGAVLGETLPPQAEWQWAVPVDNGYAFLWIPPGCDQVRGVMFGQHNMLEEGIMEHPAMREERRVSIRFFVSIKERAKSSTP